MSSVREISFKRRPKSGNADQERVPVLPIHDKYDHSTTDHDPFDDIIGAEIQITAAASGVVPDDSFTVCNILSTSNIFISLTYVVVMLHIYLHTSLGVLKVLSYMVYISKMKHSILRFLEDVEESSPLVKVTSSLKKVTCHHTT